MKANPAKFLSTTWVNCDDLRRFLASADALSHPPPSKQVKCEPDASDHVLPVKRERLTSPSISKPFKKSENFQVSFEDGKEVIEIFQVTKIAARPRKLSKRNMRYFLLVLLPHIPRLPNTMLLSTRNPFMAAIHRPAVTGKAQHPQNCPDTAQYKLIFDELQLVVKHVTGRPLLLKRLSCEGTLVSIGVDLELAQVIAAGLSFLPTNEPEFSKIPANVAPDVIVQYFVRACLVHVKRSDPSCDSFSLSVIHICIIRGVHGIKPELTTAEYQRIINFPYLKTADEVGAFSKWIEGLNKPKVTGLSLYFLTSNNPI